MPLLIKDELRSGPESDHLSEAFRRECKLIQSKSSGSSGQALDVYYDRDSFSLFILAGLASAGWPSRTGRGTGRLTSTPVLIPWTPLFGMYPMEFIPTLAPIPEALARLRRPVRPTC